MIYNLGVHVFAALCASSVEGMKRPICREMLKNHRLMRRLKGEHLQPGWTSRRRLNPSDVEKMEAEKKRESEKIPILATKSMKWKVLNLAVPEPKNKVSFLPLHKMQAFEIYDHEKKEPKCNNFVVNQIEFFVQKCNKQKYVMARLALRSVRKTQTYEKSVRDRYVRVTKLGEDNFFTIEGQELELFRKIFGYERLSKNLETVIRTAMKKVIHEDKVEAIISEIKDGAELKENAVFMSKNSIVKDYLMNKVLNFIKITNGNSEMQDTIYDELKNFFDDETKGIKREFPSIEWVGN